VEETQKVWFIHSFITSIYIATLQVASSNFGYVRLMYSSIHACKFGS